MFLLSDYRITETLNLSEDPHLYRAIRNSDQKVVLLKRFENATSKIIGTDLLTNEYKIAGGLSNKQIAHYLQLENESDHLVGVLENIEGISLQKYLEIYNHDIESCLRIAIGITEILQTFYQSQFIHQNICPTNFIIKPDTLEITLINFFDAIDLRQTGNRAPSFFGRSISYIAPEQTGRIKCDIDCRSDLYSSGIILYQLLTRHLPFESQEALAVIHSHIAKSPASPHELNAAIPLMLSDITMRLIAKNPENRYQTPFGLKHDLLTCLKQWTENSRIDFFKLGKADFSGQPKPVNQLYGREAETQLLNSAFDGICEGQSKIIFIEGFSGIGKSALVHEFKKNIEREYFFLEAKFNQFQKNTPYFGFQQAFETLIDFILLQEASIKSEWQAQISEALGVNGHLLTNILPQLELLLGAQAPLSELEPNELKNRLHYVFSNFLRTISKKQSPVILFLDDLQWADAASLSLLDIIIKENAFDYFLFVGAFRSNESDFNTHFFETARLIEKSKTISERIKLAPLTYNDIKGILHEKLSWAIDDSNVFIDLLYDKSQGNPFFINVFLKCLIDEKILAFDFSGFCWVWDKVKIYQLSINDNLSELLIGRIQKLGAESQHVLTTASFLGYEFKLKLMKVILGQEEETLIEHIQKAIDEDLVIETTKNTYNFSHDKIQQAAYLQISESDRKTIHLGIGRSLLMDLKKEDRDVYMFEIVNQFNVGIDLIDVQAERFQIAVLNLKAGSKAKLAAAYKPSFDYFQAGFKLLDENSWQKEYKTTLDFYAQAAESAFLSANYLQMDEWIDFALQKVDEVLDKVKFYEIRIKAYIAQQKLIESIHTALYVLKVLNINLPVNPGRIDVVFTLLKIKLALRRRPVSTLIDLPVIQNVYAEAAIRVLVSVGAAVYFARPDLFPVLKSRLFQLMIKYGNSQYSGVICNAYGLIQIAGLGNYNAGYELGKMALQLSDKYDSNSIKCQTVMMVNTFIIHWKEHLRITLKPLSHNYYYGLENGNIEFATYSALVYCHNALFCGENLVELVKKLNGYYQQFQGLKHESALNLHTISSQAIINLSEETADPIILTGRFHDEHKMISFYTETKGETGLYKIYLYKLLLAYMFGDYEAAEKNAEEARKRINSVPGSPEILIFYFYSILTNITFLSKRESLPGVGRKQKVLRNIRKFKRFAKLAPSNCSHKLLLIQAELAAIGNDMQKTGFLYDEAIDEAKKNDYINDLALIYERAGKFYESKNKSGLAQYYLSKAYKFYLQWGAYSKARSMEKSFAFLQWENDARDGFNFKKQTTKLSSISGEKVFLQLDLYTIMKAATAISSETDLEPVIKKLVSIAVENAGAERGFLIVKQGENFFIEAEASFHMQEEIVLESTPLKGNRFVSESIVRFVFDTKEDLILENAIHHVNFSDDEVIQNKKVLSVLCMPIVYQGNTICLLYLENSLINNAFTPERIEMLKLLSGQMAVSLQNAINEKKKAKAYSDREKLIEQINLQQKEFLKTKLEIQEQTFTNISEEIHDNIGQTLSFVKLMLYTLDSKKNDYLEKMQELRELLDKVIQDIRDIAKSLNANYIDNIGFANAIEKQLLFLKRTGGYQFEFFIDGNQASYGSQRELIIFRIVQELLNNIVKHAKATFVKIHMKYAEEKLIIEVSDNGKGLDKDTIGGLNSGLGIRNMQKRVSLINGTIQFDSTPGLGTIITICVAYDQHTENLAFI